MSRSDASALREKDWTSLVYSIMNGKCTLMIGPHAVTGVFRGQRLPVLVGLAEFVKEQLGEGFEHLDPTNPSSVAQAAVACEDEYVLQSWVKEFYDSLEGDGKVLADLAALPFELVVNTSPGLSADRAFREVKSNTQAAFYDRTQPANRWFPDPSADAPVVYNLYGSIERMESLILSDNDRLDFLVSVISDEPPLPRRLTAALKDPHRSFLFLGFELSQWQLRVLLHVLARNADRKYKSFAAELDEVGVDEETEAFYRADHRISFFSMNLADFASELRRRVEADQARRPSAGGETALAPDAPIVFLCHASEDKQAAKDIAAGLRKGGIATWLDEENLRGGDRWNEEVERLIGQEVDYVAVLQSANLLVKDFGYVNKEIALAMNRQQHYRAPRTFVIPVVIDDPRHRLRELEDLQSIDLNQQNSIDELVKVIRRDVARANR